MLAVVHRPAVGQAAVLKDHLPRTAASPIAVHQDRWCSKTANLTSERLRHPLQPMPILRINLQHPSNDGAENCRSPQETPAFLEFPTSPVTQIEAGTLVAAAMVAAPRLQKMKAMFPRPAHLLVEVKTGIARPRSDLGQQAQRQREQRRKNPP